MKVIATRKAFYKGALIKTNQIVDIIDNIVPKWAQQLEQNVPEQVQPEETNNTIENTNIKEQNIQETIVKTDSAPEQVQPEFVDELSGKTEQELLEILDNLQLKGLEVNIMLDDTDKKTVIEQIQELKKLLAENIDK